MVLLRMPGTYSKLRIHKKSIVWIIFNCWLSCAGHAVDLSYYMVPASLQTSLPSNKIDKFGDADDDDEDEDEDIPSRWQHRQQLQRRLHQQHQQQRRRRPPPTMRPRPWTTAAPPPSTSGSPSDGTASSAAAGSSSPATPSAAKTAAAAASVSQSVLCLTFASLLLSRFV